MHDPALQRKNREKMLDGSVGSFNSPEEKGKKSKEESAATDPHEYPLQPKRLGNKSGEAGSQGAEHKGNEKIETKGNTSHLCGRIFGQEDIGHGLEGEVEEKIDEPQKKQEEVGRKGHGKDEWKRDE